MKVFKADYLEKCAFSLQNPFYEEKIMTAVSADRPKNFFALGFKASFSFRCINYKLTLLGYVPPFGAIAAIIRIAYVFFRNPNSFRSSDYRGFLMGTILRSILEIATGPVLAIGHLFTYLIWSVRAPTSQVFTISPSNSQKPPEDVMINPRIMTEKDYLAVAEYAFSRFDASDTPRKKNLLQHIENSLTKEPYSKICTEIVCKEKGHLDLFAFVNPANMVEGAYCGLAKNVLAQNSNLFKCVKPEGMTELEYFNLCTDIIGKAPSKIALVAWAALTYDHYLALIKIVREKSTQLAKDLQSIPLEKMPEDLCMSIACDLFNHAASISPNLCKSLLEIIKTNLSIQDKNKTHIEKMLADLNTSRKNA